MKIALLPGPIPYTVSLAKALVEFCQVDFICGERYAQQNDISILSTLPDAVSVILYKEHRRSDPRSLYSSYQLVSLLKKNSYDLIHLQYSGTLPLSLFWYRISKIPFVVTIHDPNQHQGLPKLLSISQDYLQNFFSKRASAVIVHGETMRRHYCTRYPFVNYKNIFDLPHGDLSICFFSQNAISHKADNGTFEIVFFGNIRPNKGVEFLIKAEPYISEKLNNCIIKIFGEGDLSQSLRLIKNRSKFEIHNRFIAHKDVPVIFSNADVIVLPYISATQSGIIPMAYAAGKPVVATRTGGLPDVVLDGITGILVEPANASALANAVITILSNDELRFKMGQNALNYCKEKLSWNSIGQKTYDIYHKVCYNKNA